MEDNLLEIFMSIGNDSQEDAEAIFQLTTNYLNELKNQKYKPEFATMVEGFINKMIVIAENFECEEEFLSNFEADLLNFNAAINNPNHQVHSIVQYYNKIYSDTIKFYNLISKKKPNDSIELGPFQPENCDKKQVILIIMQVIEIIESSNFLHDKAKSNIIKKLNDVIYELNNPKTNWNIYFTKMGNTIMFISALASIAGGIEATQNLTTAKEKLEQANYTVESTSLTYSNKDIKQVFVVNDINLLPAKLDLDLASNSSFQVDNKSMSSFDSGIKKLDP